MKKFFILATLLSLVACTTAPPRKPVANPQQHWHNRAHQLTALNSWWLSGRVAIINGTDSWNLNISWQQQDDKYVMDLSGPFGAGHARLLGTEHGVLLTDADDNQSFAMNPDNLLYEKTGVRMPVQGMKYWIRGLPTPDSTEHKPTLDEYGRLSRLKQAGWDVRFKRYVDVDQHELPEKVFINGHDLKVKLVIDEWNLKPQNIQSQDIQLRDE